MPFVQISKTFLVHLIEEKKYFRCWTSFFFFFFIYFLWKLDNFFTRDTIQ